jgi:peptide/nickel transport system permease protein
VSIAAPTAAPVAAKSRPRRKGLFRTAFKMWRTRVGLLIVGVIVFIVLLGPTLAPHDPQALIAPPNQARGHLLFGADVLGHDVWSQFLSGGRTLLVTSVLATFLGVSLGLAIGLTAAYARNWLDDVLMRTMDILLAFPAIMLALIAMATVGPKPWIIVVTVAITTTPRVSRVMRGAAIGIVERDFVAASEALGERRWRILASEILPNVTGTLVVETTLRLTYAIALIAAIAFLGFTADPTAPDWGQMINANYGVLVLNPWSTLLPVIAIGLLAVGTGLIGDGLARASSGIDRDRGESEATVVTAVEEAVANLPQDVYG